MSSPQDLSASAKKKKRRSQPPPQSIFGPSASQQYSPPDSSPSSKTPSKHNSLKLGIQQKRSAGTTSAGPSSNAASSASAQSTPSKGFSGLDLSVSPMKASSNSNTTAAQHVPPKVSLFANYGKKKTQKDKVEESSLPLSDDEAPQSSVFLTPSRPSNKLKRMKKKKPSASAAAPTVPTTSPVDLARGTNIQDPMIIPASTSLHKSERNSPPPYQHSAALLANMCAAELEEHQTLQEKIRMCQQQLASYSRFYITKEERQDHLVGLRTRLEHILRRDVLEARLYPAAAKASEPSPTTSDEESERKRTEDWDRKQMEGVEKGEDEVEVESSRKATPRRIWKKEKRGKRK